MEHIPTLTRCRHRGFDDYIKGKPLSANPYTSLGREEWIQGWKFAKKFKAEKLYKTKED